MERHASAPAVGPNAPAAPERLGRTKYNIKQFRGVLDEVSLVRSVVEKERAQALEQAHHIEKLFQERDQEAQLIQKELSVQLRCAGRSYQQILGANRQLSEDLRAEAERRTAEVTTLEQQVQELTRKVEAVVLPWKNEVSKRDLKIIKLQEAASNLDEQIRQGHLERKHERETLTSEIDNLREARDSTVKECGTLKATIDSMIDQHAQDADEIRRQARQEAVAKGLKVEELERSLAAHKKSSEKSIQELNLKIKGLEREIEGDHIEHKRYDRKLELKEKGFDKMAEDFLVKQTAGHDQAASIRATYELTIAKMDEQLQAAELECKKKLRPWEELCERQEREIKKLRDKMAEATEEQEALRQRERELEEELEHRMAAANGALELAQTENYKLNRRLETIQQEHEESAPMRQIGILNLKLEEVVNQTQVLLAKRDRELQEKTEIINNLQKRVREQALSEDEYTKMWDKRVQEKEKGYGNVVAQLKFAEGQIEEERGRTMKALQVVRKRDRSIERMKAEHAEEIKTRSAEHEALLNENQHWLTLVDNLEAEREASERRWEAMTEASNKRQADREADLRIEMLHRDEAVEEMEENVKMNKEYFDKARLSWEEKERELGVMIRNRDRSIVALQNEIEFIHESWEVKYGRLMELFEKLQKKFDDGIGHMGVIEVARRSDALKQENQELSTQIKQLKEGIRKQKKQIRDLQIDIDMVTKETADILAEKDIAMGELVGENVTLTNKLQAAIDEREALVKELKAEAVTQAESFQERVDQLEQLVEAMRFTDREALIDKIDVWKRAFERIAINRDDQEEHYKSLLDTKDKQINGVAEEYREVLYQIDILKAKAEEDLEALDKKWRGKEADWRQEQAKFQQEIYGLQTKLQLEAAKPKIQMAAVQQSQEQADHEALKAKIERQRVKKKALKAGVQELITENTDWRGKCESLEEQLKASKQDLEKHTKWRDDRYEAMMKEHEALKKILESEMGTAQDTCKDLEEQVRQFPSPFEIELEELKDRYAQTQAGMLKMSLENTSLREQLKDQKEAAQKEVDELESNLKLAHYLLKEVGSVGELRKVTSNLDADKASS